MRHFRRNFPHISPEEIIDMTTRRPARAIGMPGELGEIAPGAHADLIALPYAGKIANAFDAIIEYSAPVSWVMVGGRLQRI
jgi:imidazolonepropionase-like amidohydrolase